jgi:hypothetical protein
MINEGFKSTATKEDLTAVEDRLTTRLDRLEHLLVAEQKREIEDLQTRMKRLEDALAVSPQIYPRPTTPAATGEEDRTRRGRAPSGQGREAPRVLAPAEAEAPEPMAADVAAKGIHTDKMQEPIDETPAPRPCEARALTAGALPPGHHALRPPWTASPHTTG